MINSITIVHTSYRKSGIGKNLLDSKMKILRRRHPKINYRSFVNISNEACIKMCSSVGLTIVDEGSREKKNAQVVKFFIFEDI